MGTAPSWRTALKARLAQAEALGRRLAGRAEFHLMPRSRSFLGAYDSFDEVLAHVPSWALRGYDHAAVVDINFDAMCRLALWDYPVLFWLQRLEREVHTVLDAGGHMGTKFRAFDPHLGLCGRVRWTVFDTPSVAALGAARAAADGLSRSLHFVAEAAAAEPADLLLASGLFQYFPGGLAELLAPLAARPRYAILNKVATREGPNVVTLERIGDAFVPYQIRDRAAFEAAFDAAGYDIVDAWEIPSLGHVIRSHPELGVSVSRGYMLNRRNEMLS